jgi:hypothetical protein
MTQKNNKIVELDAIINKPVYVLVCDWSDRHGESDVNEPLVFATLKSARAAMASDVELYIDQLDGWNGDKLNTDSVMGINYEDLKTIDTKEKLRKYITRHDRLNINMDEDGTHASWSIHKVTVMW